MKEWYKTHLGLIQINMIQTSSGDRLTILQKKGSTQWSPFAETTKYFAPSEKEFMINYRVENLEQLFDQLKEAGITMADEIESIEYGKFVHIIDIEGNKIELWEPNDFEL